MGGGGGGRLFGAGCSLTFSAFGMGAYLRWAPIRGWALIRINMVYMNSTKCRQVMNQITIQILIHPTTTYQQKFFLKFSFCSFVYLLLLLFFFFPDVQLHSLAVFGGFDPFINQSKIYLSSF